MTPDPFATLAEPSRRRILDALRVAPRTVNELVALLDLSQPAVSKHLKVLRENALVTVRPEGQRRWYQIAAEPLAELDAWLAPFRELWSRRLDNLEAYLDEPDTTVERSDD